MALEIVYLSLEPLFMVNQNTLWSYFHADICVTACHTPIKLYALTWYVKIRLC